MRCNNLKQQKNLEKPAPKNKIQKIQADPTIKYGIHTPEDRDPQPKDYDEIEY